MVEYAIESWELPPSINGLPVAFTTASVRSFRKQYWRKDPLVWEMTEVQRETIENEILAKWDIYRRKLRYDGTFRLHRQLNDMIRLGGGMIVIDAEYGMGKSIIGNSFLKMWQVLNRQEHSVECIPSVYWHRIVAKRMIKDSPNFSAHSIDEDFEDSASGSQAVIKHLKNIWKTIRKTGKLAIQIGVGVNNRFLDKSVAFQIMPFGFNRQTQANRLIIKNYRDEPLFLAITQRYYGPQESVLYEGEMGTFAEYASRAESFSQSTDGVSSARDIDNEVYWKEELIRHWKEKYPGAKAKPKPLAFEARQLRIAADIEKQFEEIVGAALFEINLSLDGDSYNPTPDNSPIRFAGDGWDVLRENIRAIEPYKGFSEYHVPEVPLESYSKIVERLEIDDLLPDSLGKQIRIRRLRVTPKQIGDAGEKATESWLDSLAAKWGGGGDGVNDIYLPDLDTAINVKTTLEKDFKEFLSTSPECDHNGPKLVLLIVPRRLMLKLYHITAEHMTINARQGTFATPDTLPQIVTGMVLKQVSKDSKNLSSHESEKGGT